MKKNILLSASLIIILSAMFPLGTNADSTTTNSSPQISVNTPSSSSTAASSSTASNSTTVNSSTTNATTTQTSSSTKTNPSNSNSSTIPSTTEKPDPSSNVNDQAPQVSYSAQVQGIGWQSPVTDGALSGTMGKALRLEAVKLALHLDHTGLTGGISYSAAGQYYDWQSPVSDNAEAGTTNKALRLEALRINLTGEIAQTYSVYYRVYVQNYGWMAWTKDGENAGSIGQSLCIEALEVQLVKKGTQVLSPQGLSYLYSPTLSYQVQGQNYGWQAIKMNGALAGTVGRGLRAEAVKIQLSNLPYGLSGGVSYQVQGQNYGWQAAKTNGALAGTVGRGLRLETLKVSLTGDVAKYFNIYYQTQVQNFGWLNWANNGGNSGTVGLSYRLEAMKMQLVPKAATQPNTNGKRAYYYHEGGSWVLPYGTWNIQGQNYNVASNGSVSKVIPNPMRPMTGDYWNYPSQLTAYPNLNQYRNVNIEISKAKQRVYIKSGNTVVYTMYCSTANPSLGTTPSGNYAVQAEHGANLYEDGYAIAKTYTSWLYHGIYLFHSVVFNPNGTVNVAQAAQLGKTPQSHGCVRLSIPDARWIYNTIPVGTPVHVD